MTSPVDAIGPTATLPTDYDPSSATVNSSGEGASSVSLDPQAFLQLLVAQLKYQDPTNPVDTSDFMNQTAMLSQVQTMNTMSDTLTSLMTAQQTSAATAMIGKAVSFVDPSGQQSSGIVDSVSFSKGTATLHVGNYGVPLSGVLAVADPVPVDAGGSAAVDGAGDASGTSGTTGADDAAAGADTTDPAGAADTSSSATDPGATTDTGSAATDPGPSALAATIRPDTITA